MALVALLLALLTGPALAYHQVEGAIDHHSLLVRLDPGHGFRPGDKAVMISHDDQTLLAIGTISRVDATTFPPQALVYIEEIIANKLVRPGDALEPLTPEVLERYHVQGHVSLMLSQEESVPARYKDLAYLGVFNADGHTLGDGEWLVSIPQVQYGVNKNLTVKVLNSLYLDGFANAGAKVRLMRNQWGHLTMNSLVSRQVDRDDWVALAGLTLTMPSSEKFQSHLVINARVEGMDEENPEVEKLNLFPPSDIRTIYEYINSDWDRFLFGPLFNFDTQTVGGTFSQMWIWDTFHLNFGVATKDVSEAEFSSKGYNVIFDFFWRF